MFWLSYKAEGTGEEWLGKCMPSLAKNIHLCGLVLAWVQEDNKAKRKCLVNEVVHVCYVTSWQLKGLRGWINWAWASWFHLYTSPVLMISPMFTLCTSGMSISNFLLLHWYCILCCLFLLTTPKNTYCIQLNNSYEWTGKSTEESQKYKHKKRLPC